MFSFEAIGTKWKIDIFQNILEEKEAVVKNHVMERVALFEATYSRFSTDSWLYSLSQKAGDYVLPDDAEPLFSLYHNLYVLSKGLMTPLIGQVLADAGYDKDYSFKRDLNQPLSSPPLWDDVIAYYPDSHPPHITIQKPALLDFGAIGKGYCIDIAAGILEKEGIAAYCINAGGDIVYRNTTLLRVGLEDPRDPKKVIGVITLGNKSIAGSSGNRRKWPGFNHIINPATLSSPDHIAAVWVVADSTMLADAMTTALYFCPPEVLLAKYDFQYLIMYADASVKGSLVGSPMVELF